MRQIASWYPIPLILIALFWLCSCTAEQQARAGDYQTKIAALCRDALPFAAVPGIGIYIAGGCATEAAIAKLALDPSSIEWLNGLIRKARGL